MANATFKRVRDFAPPALRYSYLQTEISVEIDGQLLPVAGFVERIGAPIFVITAENPRSEPQAPSTNKHRTSLLQSTLEEAGYEWWWALGGDPHSDWQEASFAVVGPSSADVRTLCRRFGQLAYFEVRRTRQIVRGVFSRWELARTHGSDPLPVTSDRLSDAVFTASGLEINDSLRRFRHRGWESVSTSEEPCDVCGALVDLYGLVHRQRSGETVEHLAVCCPNCGWVNAATQLGRDRLRTVELWYDYQIALADAGTRRVQANRRCYVIDLDMPTGPAVYVGETGKTVEERFREHRDGERSSPDVRRYGVELNYELMQGLPEFPDEMSSRTFEVYLGKRLARAGRTVRGAH